MNAARDERPAPRSRPRPAPDEGTDPILSAPSAPAIQAPAPARPVVPRLQGRRGAVPTVQLNTRVSPEMDDVVNAVAEERGWTKRAVIEHALELAYPDETARSLSS